MKYKSSSLMVEGLCPEGTQAVIRSPPQITIEYRVEELLISPSVSG
jgi:hypothetical protein